MKLFEEFKLYEEMWEDDSDYSVDRRVDADGTVWEDGCWADSMWDDETRVCKSYHKEVNGKTYNLVNPIELRAAMEAAQNSRRAMFLVNIILDSEAARFADEDQEAAWNVWQEYKADHNLK